MLVFASFWDLFLKPFWIVFGSTFGAWVANISPKCHHKSMQKLASKKVVSEEARLPETRPAWRGVRGEVNFPLGLGGSEERKKRIKEERK